MNNDGSLYLKTGAELAATDPGEKLLMTHDVHNETTEQ